MIESEQAVEEYKSKLRAILTERSKGEYDTWGFVAMFLGMIDEASQSTQTTTSTDSTKPKK